jgi:hypothetical protein
MADNDKDKVTKDPALSFKNPQDVVTDPELSRDQKIEILHRWEYDLRELQVLDDESTTAKKPGSVTLDSVLTALRALGAPIDLDHSAPTKQGGS